MRRTLSILIVVVLVIASAAFIGISQLQGKPQPEYSADVVDLLSGGDPTGYARALTIRDFKFPADHGAHPEYQTEWWYYTGNLATTEGRRFGFEFTIFRRSLTPSALERTSDWATNQVYFADFAISDIGGNQFFAKERFSRGAAGLAGATVDPHYRVWIEDWSAEAKNDNATSVRLKGTDGPIAIDLIVNQTKPPTLEGDRGLSAKNPEPGNASYYYSLTRLASQGTLTVNGTAYQVTGNSWMDHEFSTSVLGKDAVGWDWFSLQLDSNREIMIARIRNKDGSYTKGFVGTLIEADGSTKPLTDNDYSVEPTGQTWTSIHTGATYPAGWKVTVQSASGPIVVEVTPLMADQELNSTTAYWEGACAIKGTENGKPMTGYGYVELTGYNIPKNIITGKESLTRQGN